MQGLIQGLRSCQEIVELAVVKNSRGRISIDRKNMFSRFGCVNSSGTMEMEEKGLENMTVADVLMTKGEENIGSWLWCRINDNVDDAMKNMAEHNIGSLVVLKPGQQQHIAGIITERGKDHHNLESNRNIHQYLGLFSQNLQQTNKEFLYQSF
ncbi:hypothetical protein PTKIN_Ptkin09bG0118300 [Pterospermum kingtungense]